MKSIFLSFVLYYGLFTNSGHPAPFLGKWHNVSKASTIEEVVFYPNNNVKLSNNTYALNQWYGLSPDSIEPDKSFNGVFRIINVSRLVKESKVSIRLLKQDVMELKIDDKKMIFRKE